MTKQGILNYSTAVPAATSIAEISKMLAQGGAKAIMQEYDDDGDVTNLSFKMIIAPQGDPTQAREIGFRLPNNWPAVQVIMQQKRKADSRHTPVWQTTKEHAVNITWRILKDWIEAQLALIKAQQVRTEQVFLPYAITKDGSTLSEKILTDPQMLLGGGNG